MESDVLPLIAFASKVGVCPLTVRRWVAKGVRGIKLRAERRGGRLLIHEADYREWQARLETPKQPPVIAGRLRGSHAAAMAWARERGLA